jgi:hypothetical protein
MQAAHRAGFDKNIALVQKNSALSVQRSDCTRAMVCAKLRSAAR